MSKLFEQIVASRDKMLQLPPPILSISLECDATRIYYSIRDNVCKVVAKPSSVLDLVAAMAYSHSIRVASDLKTTEFLGAYNDTGSYISCIALSLAQFVDTDNKLYDWISCNWSDRSIRDDDCASTLIKIIDYAIAEIADVTIGLYITDHIIFDSSKKEVVKVLLQKFIDKMVQQHAWQTPGKKTRRKRRR